MVATLAGLIDALRGAEPQHGLCLVDAGGRETAWTWRELHELVRRRAAWMHARGVEARHQVVVCPSNEADVVVGFLALLRLGAVPLAVGASAIGQDLEVQRTLVRRLRADFGARWVFGQPELPTPGDDGVLDLAADAAGSEAPPSPDLHPDDLALVQFSSGSTAQPKGVRLTHANVLSNLRLVVEAGARHQDEALVTWLPLCHDMGLVGTFLASLLVRPRRFELMHPMRFLLRPATWFDRLSRTRSRVSACPSFALDLAVERVDVQALRERNVDLRALELLLVGAETVRPETLRRFERAFAPLGLGAGVLRPVYGLAEATLIVTAPRADEAVERRTIDGTDVVSVGRPLGDFELRIVREADGTVASPGEVGEIRLRGGSVTPGYLDGSAHDTLFEDGWLRTGDLGALDEDGRLYVTGRSKDLLIVDGRNHYAHDVAEALADLGGVKRGAVHAFTARVSGRKRVVVLASPARGAADGLDQAIRRRVLARCGLAVDDVLLVPRIPRTSSGKIKRDACLTLYVERTSS